MSDTQKTIAVAMSGGVDSTVSAALLQKDYDVTGFYMDLALPGQENQISEVRGIAQKLGIPLQIVDLSQIFHKEIISYFCNSYLAGITPNPCAMCNPTIKFGRLLDAVRSHGIEKMATGHYVRLKKNNTGVHLLKGLDNQKDQSYFLCNLSQQQLRHTAFPLGQLTKTEVYRLAQSLGFDHQPSTESQDICFLANRSLADFLGSRKKAADGDIVNAQGQVVGRHQGIFKYTVGQRRGLGICHSTPYYVTALSAKKNQVIVGKEADLWHNTLLVKNMNWLAGAAPTLPGRFFVKIRYRHQAAEADVVADKDLVKVVFKEPQRAISPGQFAVFYHGDEVIGGGEILRHVPEQRV